MPDKKPNNILEAIFYGVEITNQNLLVLSENLNDAFDKIVEMQNRVDAMLAFFNQPAPEKPTIPGAEDAVTESRES